MQTFLLNGIIPVNSYVFSTENNTYIVDPGSDKEQLLEIIKNNNIDGVLLTHGHADHIGLIGLFKCPIYIHEEDYEMIINDSINCYKLLGLKHEYDVDKLNIIKIKDEDIIDGIKVIHTPGHTKGSVSFLYKNKLFSGDTIFKSSIGRTDLPTGDMKKMKESILKLMELDDHINIYPGHDNKTTIKDEKKYNPYYLQWKKK